MGPTDNIPARKRWCGLITLLVFFCAPKMNGHRLPVKAWPLVFSRLQAEKNKSMIKYSCAALIK